jgi:hypothetical protein
MTEGWWCETIKNCHMGGNFEETLTGYYYFDKELPENMHQQGCRCEDAHCVALSQDGIAFVEGDDPTGAHGPVRHKSDPNLETEIVPPRYWFIELYSWMAGSGGGYLADEASKFLMFTVP